mmetsp:Transcript_9660/g.20941  ORF Transcript_9660/g.20941 Transcript_9660/m.20941 type:complete len:123 (-) Transcript_9660:467-835(-)
MVKGNLRVSRDQQSRNASPGIHWSLSSITTTFKTAQTQNSPSSSSINPSQTITLTKRTIYTLLKRRVQHQFLSALQPKMLHAQPDSFRLQNNNLVEIKRGSRKQRKACIFISKIGRVLCIPK